MKTKGIVLALLLALVATGCASPTDTGGPTDSGDGGGEKKTVKIGFIGPLTGSLGAFGGGMRKSAELAIKQANKDNRIDGWTIELAPEDDAADAKTGAAAAQKLASDTEVAAVIGTLNTSVALAVQPVLDEAGIAMISPANTGPALTMGENWQKKPKRPFETYFRVVATDREQGKAAAEYAYEELDRRNAVIMHDKKAYGQGLSTIFAAEFKALGGKTAATIEVNPGEGDYKSAVTKAKSSNPDLIFYGGEFPEAGVIAKNMGELGLNAPETLLLGGDGILDQKFVDLGGPGADGHYATLVGATADKLEGAAGFVTDYKEEFGDDSYSAFGPPSYDTANLIIDALETALEGADAIDTDVRAAVVAAIQDISYEGVLGTTSFNEFGDTTNAIITVNQVKGGKFVAVKTLELEAEAASTSAPSSPAP